MTQQAQPKATDRRRVLEANHAEVVALLATGTTQPDIAQRFGVARSSVLRFVERNAQEIQAKKQRVDLAVEDFEIAKKVNRIADLDMLRRLALEEIKANGYAWTEETKYGVKRKVSGAVQALQDADHQAAEELAQLPRPTVEVSEHKTYILQVVVDGHGNPPIG